ncbi:MAG TPA: HDIG domain-containing protein [Bacteroidales bacterium]|nr:HDIG domain-containing protein [Bacteroidales bacterium]
MGGRHVIRIRNLIFFMIAIAAVTAVWPENSGFIELAGSFMITSLCFIVLYLFIAHYCPEVLKITVKTIFLLSLILSFTVLTRIAVSYEQRNLLPFIPFALVAVIVRTFYDGRLAFFILLLTVSLSAFFVPEPFSFTFMHIITGIIAVFTLTNNYGRWKFFITALAVMLSYSFIHLSFSLLLYDKTPDFTADDLLIFAGNSLLILLCYPLIQLFESRFKFLSDATLLELADTNQPLLRKLADEAPGSFQHSLQVANLAEEAARSTGANPLLVRAGALYHDIGKISGPLYFIENQKSDLSPHDKLDPLTSAKMIINHVVSGITLAKNFKVPSQIIDFISTHHGTSVTYYFIRKFSEKFPLNPDKEKDFSYPGPKPFSKETAIVMMADAVEASSRSLEKQTEETISELVERIILLQEQSGQYSDVPFTFRDISDIKESFKRRLSTIYHGRIAYK